MDGTSLAYQGLMVLRALVRSWFAITALFPFVACGGGTDKPSADGGLPERCSLPSESGPCLAYSTAYYHDKRTGLCTPFVYGGCGGNENRFAEQGDCEAACVGGTPDFGDCSVPSDCVLASPGCCAACDPVDRGAFVALNRKHIAEHVTAIGCDSVACSPCQEVPEEQKTSGYFAPTCMHGRCVVLDVRATPATQCKESTDCHLRDGAACCEGCDAHGIVAISSEDTLRSFVCDADPSGCPPCAPLIPKELAPACVDGQCQVSRVP